MHKVIKEAREYVRQKKYTILYDSHNSDFPDEGEEISIKLANVTPKARKGDEPFLSLSYQYEKLNLNCSGFDFKSTSDSNLLLLYKAIAESHISVKKYKKRRLHPFRSNMIYEMKLTNNGNTLILSGWGDELVYGCDPDRALKTLMKV